MDELTGLMQHSFLLDDRDNIVYVTDIGKRLNMFSENIAEIPLQIHKEFLFEVETLFVTIKEQFIDNVDSNEEYGENPRLLAQFILIRDMIRNFFMTIGDEFSLKFKYQFAKQALIQLYFIAHEADNSEVWYNTNIHDYERPVTFYEYEIESLEDTMRGL